MGQKFNPLSGQFDIVLDKASEIKYDNTTSGLTATDTQAAIDELDSIIDALPDPIVYAGTWNAATNTPTLDNSDTGVTGFLYRVTVAGTVDFGAGPIAFEIGDSVVNNGTLWEKWDHSDQVLSVNTQTGAVVLDTDDISEGVTNLYFTDSRAQGAITGGASTIVTSNLTADSALISNPSGKVAVSATTATELGYVSGVTSAIQTQLNAKEPTITGAATTITSADLTIDRAVVSDGAGKVAVSTTTATELGYVSGVTSAIQTQLNAKEPTITGAATTITSADLTIDRAVVSDGAGKVAVSTTTATELGYVSGVTSAIQTQLDTKLASANQVQKNYLGVINGVNNNGNFELGTTAGWSLGNVTLTGTLPSGFPSFGSGANVNLLLATNSINPLSGLHNARYSSTVATTAGNLLASPAFTIDLSDQAKVQTFKFSYRATTNPNNANWSGTSSNSFGVAIFNATTGAWIIPAGIWSMTQSSGVGIATGTFQTDASSTQYRLVIFNANATSGGIVLDVDDFTLGPQTAPIGPVVTDWVSFTPTGSWVSNANYTGKWRRVGDSMEVQWKVACTGTPTAANLQLNLPSGYSIDTAKMVETAEVIVGTGQLLDTGTNSYASVYAKPSGTTGVVLVVDNNGAGGTLQYSPEAPVSNTVPFTFGNTDTVTMNAILPITGWSSNVQMSNDTDTRVVDFYGTSTANTAFTGGTITMAYTAVVDTHSSYNGSNTYTIPVSGIYKIQADTTIYQNTPGGGNSFLQIVINGGTVKQNYVAMPTQNAAMVQSNSWEGILKAGDTVQVQMSNSYGAMQILGSTVGAKHSVAITRLSGPSVIAATESVNARYTTTNGQSVADGATNVITTMTKVYDSHNAWNATTGVYTVPVSGKYRVSGNFESTSAARTGGSGRFAILNVSGTASISGPLYAIWATITTYIGCGVSTTKDYNAGDTISFSVVNQTGSTIVLDGNAAGNYFTIERVGN